MKKKKPYVVSADIYLLLKKWAKQNNFILPHKKYFENIRDGFSKMMLKIFPEFEFVSEEEISGHILEVTSDHNLPCVSLDPIYSTCDFSIELTRKVNWEKNDMGLQCRSGSPTLLKQLKLLKASDINDVCLVDDVIYSGALIERIIRLLFENGIKVPLVCAGIGIQKGIDRINKTERKIYCKKIYSSVVDEVCERDFYPGIPYSGRSLVGKENIGLPYVLPFGKPGEWASIPVGFQKMLSTFCINQTINLFEEIQSKSNRKICCSDVKRKVPGQPSHGSYVDFLKSLN